MLFQLSQVTRHQVHNIIIHHCNYIFCIRKYNLSGDIQYSSTAIQIFFVEERQHWITTALLNGELYLFDSCFNGTLSPSVERHIAQMYGPLITDNGLLLSVVPIQQQEGANNCGVFAIAAAYHAAARGDLGSMVFDEGKMRNHLIKCFEQGRLTRFPQTTKVTPQKGTFKVRIPLHSNLLPMQEAGFLR